MPDYNKKYDGYPRNLTRGDVAAMTMGYESGTLACSNTQATNAMSCDCLSVPPVVYSSCTLCYSNETLSSSLNDISVYLHG